MANNNIGGIADKLGNRYEAKWLVRQLLDVMSGQAQWLQFEGISAPFKGFEAAVRKEPFTEWHQTKIKAPHGSWTVAALEREQVLSAFARRLRASATDRCIFVSQDPARDVGSIAERAARANDLGELIGSLSQKEREPYDKLKGIWAVDDATMHHWLARCSFRTIPASEIDIGIETIGSWLLDGHQIFGALRDYLEERFNKVLSTELVRKELQNHDGARFKHWQLDPTLIERINAETDGYLASHVTLGSGRQFVRPETATLGVLIGREKSPRIVLLTGVAGAGKSGVVRGLIELLRSQDIQHLALRIDHHLDACSPQHLGQALTGRNESPAVTLKKLSPNRPSVLIVDQVDSVSDAAGRSGPAKSAVLRLVDDVEALASMTLVLVCRTFDLGSDARLKQLEQSEQIAKLEVQLLDWETEVKPLLLSLDIDPNALTASQRELLRLPLNLGIFLELSGEGGHFASRSDLFEALLEYKEREIRKKHTVAWSIYQALGAAVEWMSERQRLDAPPGTLAGYVGAVDILASEHLIISSRGRLGLFHESLFDHLYARQFATQPRSLHALLTAPGSQQHLFRRTQARQILESLRQSDRPRYLRELKEVLQSPSIRFHVKHAIVLWVGALVDPTRDELRIVAALDDGGASLPQLIRLGMLGSTGWFALLREDGWIERQLCASSEDRLNRVLHWLSARVRERTAEVVNLLRAWWSNDPERGKVLLRWLGFVPRDVDGEPLVALCEAVIRASGEDDLLGRNDMILSNWVGRGSAEAARILRALSDRWFATHPGQHPLERGEVRDLDLYDIEEFAKRSPAAFLDGITPFLVRSLEIINERQQAGQRDYTFLGPCRDGEVFGADKLIAIYRKSMCQVAAEAPNKARGVLASLDPQLHRILLHFHLEAITASNGVLAGNLVPLLSLKVAEAGWEGAEWKSFADAARVSLPHLSAKDRNRVEQFILSLMPEVQRAAEMARTIGETGSDQYRCRDNVIWWLNRSGEDRWAILETIGMDLLSPLAAGVLQEGRRKFKGRLVPTPREMHVHWVGSPIARDRAAHMPDEHWLRAMTKHATDDGRPERHDRKGGANQLGNELQHLTKAQPARFIRLLARIPDSTNPTYVDHILRGLAEADDVDAALVADAVRLVSELPGRHHESAIVRLFERHPTLANDAALLDLLLWIAEHGAADESNVGERGATKDEPVTIDDLISRGSRFHSHGINTVRGQAAEALEQVLWKVPGAVDQTWSFLERRVAAERLVSVRCCLVRPLLPLFNSDKARCARALEGLVTERQTHNVDDLGDDQSTAPLVTDAARHLLQFVMAQVPDVGRGLVKRLLASSNETFRLVGAWHALRASYASYTRLADEMASLGPRQRRLAAALAADAAVHDEFRDRAEGELIKYFDDEDHLTREQAAQVFREIRDRDFREYRRLATAYVASQAFDGESWSFLRLLEKGTGDLQDLVVAAAERVVADLARNGTAGGRRVSELRTLQDLIRRDYGATENNEQLRSRLLDVIDAMLVGDFYGSEAIVKDHDR
jgi:hypothetical protein